MQNFLLLLIVISLISIFCYLIFGPLIALAVFLISLIVSIILIFTTDLLKQIKNEPIRYLLAFLLLGFYLYYKRKYGVDIVEDSSMSIMDFYNEIKNIFGFMTNIYLIVLLLQFFQLLSLTVEHTKVKFNKKYKSKMLKDLGGALTYKGNLIFFVVWSLIAFAINKIF
jgi:hypothetical protein